MEKSTHDVVQHTLREFEIFTIDNLFTDHEIALFTKIVESRKDDALRFTHSPFSNGKIVSIELSDIILERIRPHLPLRYGNKAGFRSVLGTACYIMFAEIAPGQQFGIHTDTGCVFEQNGQVASSHTVLIYLNDDFEGGGTQFYQEGLEEICCIQPKKNRTLCFDIDLYHKGNTVHRGFKKWLGTELVCGL